MDNTFELKAARLMEYIGTDCADDKKAIIEALKEQDRDTRHKCAEEVLYADNGTQAHYICMNTVAG